MTSRLNFPTALMAALLGLAADLAFAQIDPDADLKAKRAPLEESLKIIDAERLAFQRDLAKREQECLKRFFASACLEPIREEHLKEMRGFDLRREAVSQDIRNIDAELRNRNRTRRIEDRDGRQKPGEKSPEKSLEKSPAKGPSS